MDNLAVDGVSYPSACDSKSGEIAVQAQSGLAPFTYSWSNGATTKTATGLPQGNYTVTVTDANGFTQTKSFAVGGMGKPPKPFNLTAPAAACGLLNLTWDGPVSGTYQIRYRQGNAVAWTVVGDIGNVKTYSLQLNPSNGLNFEYAVRYVCANNRQSAWVGKSGTMKCNEAEPRGAETVEIIAGSTNAMRVFPNPAHDVVHIRFAHPETDPVSLRVFDSAGRMVMFLPDQVAGPDNLYSMVVNQLHPGVYLIASDHGDVAKLLVDVQR
jgi:hypothetical protein